MTGYLSDRGKAALDAYLTREPDDYSQEYDPEYEEQYDQDAALSSEADDRRKAEKEDAIYEPNAEPLGRR